MATKSVTMTTGKIKSSYDLKGKTTLNIVDNYSTGVNADSYLSQFVQSIDASGNNLILNCHDTQGEYKITLKNCTTLATINVSLNNDFYSYTGDALKKFLDDLKNTIKNYDARKLTVTGSFLNDKIDMTDSGYVAPTSGKNKDKGLTINGGNGDDEITGTNYNDTITGGKGENIIHYTKGDGNDIINLTQGEQFLLEISGISDITDLKFEYANKNKDLRIYTDDTKSEYITIKNFASKDVTNNSNARKGITDTSYVHLTVGGKTYDLRTSQDITDTPADAREKIYAVEITGKGYNYTGTWLNDVIDASEVEGRTQYVKIDGKKQLVDQNSNKGLTLNGGVGNDIITGSKYSDTITGGAGENTIKILNNAFGNDTINLTKGEKLTLDMSAYDDINSAEDLKEKVKVSGNNLVITTDNGKITLKNFAKSNVVGANGEVKVLLKKATETEQAVYADLNIDEVLSYTSSDFSINAKKKTATFTGSRFGETITDDTTLNGYTKTINTGNGVNTVRVSSSGKVTVNGGSGVDDIRIEGQGTHIVKTGNGENVVTITGKGTATITGGADKDTIRVYNNDSNTTINAGNGNNVVCIQGSTAKNTVTTGSGADTITLATNADGITSTVNAGNGQNTISFEGKGNNTIISGKDNDTINVNTGTTNTTIKAGKGENTINIANGSTFGNITLTEEKVNAKNIINFKNAIDNNYTLIKSGNDLIIQNDTNDSKIKIQGYYLTRTSKTKYAEIELKINGTSKTVDELLSLTGKGLTIGGSGTITGTENSDNILANDYDENIKASNDIITAGKGNDTINAGQGKNTIKFNVGDGADIIEDGGGTDTLVFAKGVAVTAKYVENDLVISYGTQGDTITLKDYTTDHSVKNIQIGTAKAKSIETYLPEPEKFLINQANLIQGTEEADNITIKTAGVNKVYAGNGNDTVTTGGNYSTNYVYAGKGDDTIISGSGTDIIYGGSGENLIHFNKGSATDYFYEDKVNNTLVFDNITFSTDSEGKVTGLGNLKIEKTPGSSMGYYSNCNLKISGYGTTTNGVEDSVYIQNYFNLTDYDFSGYKLQDKNGKTIDIYDAVSIGVKNGLIYTGFDGPIYYGAESSETIYVKTENQGDNPAYSLGMTAYTNSRGGNDTIYSGGIYLWSKNTTDNSYYRALIKTGDGDNIIHAEGNKVYFTTDLKGLKYNKSTYESQFETSVVNSYGTDDKTITTVYNSDHIYITPQKDVMTGYFFFVYQDDGEGNITSYEKIANTNKYSLYATDKDSDNKTMYIYHAENLADCRIQGKKTYAFDYGDKVESGRLATYMYGEPGIVTGDGNNVVYIGRGSWLQSGNGNDTVYGDGTIVTGGGNDKIYLSDDNFYAGGLADTYYNVDAQAGNDYIDITDVKGSTADRVHEFDMGERHIVYGAESVEINHSEGVDTLVIDPNSDVPVHIYLWQTNNDGSGVWNQRSYNYHSNAYNNYTAFKRGDDLIIATGNCINPSSGTLIIKDYYAKNGENDIFSTERKASIQLCFDPSFRQENDDFLAQSYMTLDEFVEHVGIADYYEWEATNQGYLDDVRTTRENNLWFEVINNADKESPNAVIDTPTLYQKELVSETWNNDTQAYEPTYRDSDAARGKYILGGNGAQTIYGGDGNDVIFGDDINSHDEEGNYISTTNNDGNDIIYAGKGNDYIKGGGGNDFIDGGTGVDYLDGGDGDDILVGGSIDVINDNNTKFNYKEIHGGDGSDTIYSIGAYTDGNFDENKTQSYQGGTSYFRSNIYGEAGDDIIHANGFSDKVYAGEGNDTIYAYNQQYDGYYNSNSTSEIFAGEGNDNIILKNSARVQACGEAGDDTIDARLSTADWNELNGGDGNDTIYGGSGIDLISGGKGDNYIDGGDGDDDIGCEADGDNIIYGGKGNDTITTSGTSKVYGGDDDDTIYFATGYRNAPSNLLIDGGDGDDTYITAQVGYGYDTIVASEGNDVIRIAEFDYQTDRYGKSSYQQKGDDLVLTLNHQGYFSGLILKDYYKNPESTGFENFSVVTTNDAGAEAMTGKFSIPQFLDYLDGNSIYLENGVAGDHDELISSSKATINAYGGNDFVLATGKSDATQTIDLGSGNNTLIARAGKNIITAGDGDNYMELYSYSGETKITAGNGKNEIKIASESTSGHLLYNIELGNGDNNIYSVNDDIVDAVASYNIETGSGVDTLNIGANYCYLDEAQNKYLYSSINTGKGNDIITNSHYSTNNLTDLTNDGEGREVVNTLTISGGAGNDTISSNYGVLKGGEDDDTYILNRTSHVYIDDNYGNNTIKFADFEGTDEPTLAHDKLHLIFNDGNNTNFTSMHSDSGDNNYYNTNYSMAILSDKNTGFNVGNLVSFGLGNYSSQAGIKVTTDSIDNITRIESSDGYYINQTDIQNAKAAVASWLSTNGGEYTNIQDLLKNTSNGQDDLVTSLIETVDSSYTWKAIS